MLRRHCLRRPSCPRLVGAGAYRAERVRGMAYSVRVEQIGLSGVPRGRALFYETETEMEAITVATYEVSIGGNGPQRVATVFNPAGKLVLAYAGRAKGDARDGR